LVGSSVKKSKENIENI